MRRSSTLALAVAILTIFIGGAVFGQRPQEKQDTPTQLRALEVRLPITVKKKDDFIKGLIKQKFEVYEDGKLQVIKEFLAPSDLPLRIAILMDTSNSVKLKLPFEKDAAEDFIATVTTFRRRDQLLLATFDSNVELHQDFTDNQEVLIRTLRKLKAGGYTKLYDGVHRIIEEKMSTLQNLEGQRPDSRRIIVIISDGEDTASEHSLKQAIEIAQRYDVTIFGISTKNFKGTGAGTVESSDDKKLRQLCEETGGQIFLPSQKIELFRAFSNVADDLRQEYVIFYEPINQDKTGKFREIKVKLKGVDGDLFHKRGYTY